MKTLFDRLLEICKDQGIENPRSKDVSRICKISSGRPSQIKEAGESARLGADTLQRLVALGYSPSWIQEGKQPKFLSPLSYGTNGGSMAESNAEQAPALGPPKRVPVVGTASLGDNGFWAELESPVGFGDGFVPFPTKSSSAYALRCRGDSMKPRIKDGEFVIVDPEVTPSPGDEVLVKSKDGRVMVKELLYVRDDAVHLLSVNEAHGKMSIPLPDVERLHYVAAIAKRSMWQTY